MTIPFMSTRASPSLVIFVGALVTFGDAAFFRTTPCLITFPVAHTSTGYLGYITIVSLQVTAEDAAIGRSAVCVSTLACRRTTPSMLPAWGAVVVGGVGDMWFGYAAVRAWYRSGSLVIGVLVPMSSSLATLATPPAVRCATWPGR